MSWIKRKLGLLEPDDEVEQRARLQEEHERRLRELAYRVQVIQRHYTDLDKTQ